MNVAKKWVQRAIGLCVLLGILGIVAVTQQKPDTVTSLTSEQRVVSYIRQYHRLPDYYVTKKIARSRGWNASVGNLCQVLPGKVIGGDIFANRERQLPSAYRRVWREADINYRCGRRGAERLLYSNDGLIYVSRNHYRDVVQVE